MRFTKKVWGTVCRGEQCEAFTLEHIQILPSFCCSIHRHHFRHNQFVLTAGTLAVLTWPTYAGLDFPSGLDLEEAYGDAQIRVDTAAPGRPKSLFVPVGMLHQFCSLSPVDATEIYTPFGQPANQSLGDIERFSQGGPAPPGLLDRIARQTDCQY